MTLEQEAKWTCSCGFAYVWGDSESAERQPEKLPSPNLRNISHRKKHPQRRNHETLTPRLGENPDRTQHRGNRRWSPQNQRLTQQDEPSQHPGPEPRSLMAYLLLFAPRVETLAGNCKMARLATTTEDPVEGAVLDTVSRCAADLSLKASEANRRRGILNKRHLHHMSPVKDIRKGFVMVGDD